MVNFCVASPHTFELWGRASGWVVDCNMNYLASIEGGTEEPSEQVEKSPSGSKEGKSNEVAAAGNAPPDESEDTGGEAESEDDTQRNSTSMSGSQLTSPSRSQAKKRTLSSVPEETSQKPSSGVYICESVTPIGKES